MAGSRKIMISGDARCGLYIVNNRSERMSALFGPDSRRWHPVAPFWSHFGRLLGGCGHHLGSILGAGGEIFDKKSDKIGY